LIRVDSEAIRRKAMGDCSRARTTFHKAEAELEAYEQHDIPAFSRWYRVTFGPELEAIRESKAEAEALSQTIWRLNVYAQMAGCSFAKASKVFEETPDAFARNEARMREEHRRREEAHMREQEKQKQRFISEMFPRLRRFLKSLRSEIRQMKRRGWSVSDIVDELFMAFAQDEGLFGEELMVLIQDKRVHTLLEELELMPNQDAESPDEDEEAFRERRQSKRPGPPGPRQQTEDARIKALKRDLAFALHPDQDGGDDPRKLELWHQVQEAVAARDVDRLEVIQAHLHMLTGEVSPKTPVSRLMALTNMYRESRNALRRRIRKLRQAPEWGFRELDDSGRNALRDRLSEEVLSERRRAESGLRNVRAEYRELKQAREFDPFVAEPSLFDLFDEADFF
jgi:hypothetical protein